MNRQIRIGKAPNSVKSVHNANSTIPKSKIHVHFIDGTSLNIDGTIHDAIGGIPSITKSTRKWLENYGWSIPKIFWR